MTFLIPLIPTIIFILLCVVPLSTIIFLFKRQIRAKKTPLNIELLRSPGQTLQGKIEDLTADILIKALFIPLVPLTIYSIYATQVVLTEKNVSDMVLYVYLMGAAAFIFSLSRDVYTLIKDRNLLGLGYQCKVAVGQELTQLASLGYRVFHDFPADNFNIDHIAVGPQGVFAIDTKGRAKNRKQENDNWKLKFDGQKLMFPGWSEDEPVKQAQRQSSWLANWLEKSTGEKYKTTPVLAIPGWQIERLASSDTRIFNGKNPTFLTQGPVVLNDKQINSISFQIDKQCRAVATKAYNL